MAVGNSSFVPKDIQLAYAKNNKISNPVLLLANTEYQITLVGNCKQFLIKSREMAKLQISFISGNSNIVFFTIWPGSFLCLTAIDFVSENLFITSNKANTTIELLELY